MLIRGKNMTRTETIRVRSPYSGEIVGEVARCTPQDIPQIMAAAAEGFETMRRMPCGERAAILQRAASVVLEHREELARLLVLEVGKTITEARGEVGRAAGTLQLSADAARRLSGETIPMDLSGASTKLGYFRRVPLGVTLAITPFNFPLNLACHKLGPALGAGNSVVLKPASKTPLATMRLVELLLGCGLPPEAVTVTCGAGETLGNALVEQKAVRKVSFTGSYAVGEEICRRAGVKKVTMELGSSGAVVVTPDTDIGAAAKKLCTAGYGTAGQVCISVQRVYAHKSVKDALVEAMCAEAQGIVWGDPMEEGTRLGPMISGQALEIALGCVQEAVGAGAKLVCGGRREGNILLPTLLENATEDCAVIQEEMFAPVITVNSYRTLDEAVEKVNHCRYGLQAGILTRRIDDAMMFAEKADCGGVIINDTCNCRVDNMPYGGVKDSGIGREGPDFAIREMTELKMVVIDRGL